MEGIDLVQAPDIVAVEAAEVLVHVEVVQVAVGIDAVEGAASRVQQGLGEVHGRGDGMGRAGHRGPVRTW